MNEGRPLRPAVFLDRDGTINREVDYLSDPADLELLPGAASAIARFNEADWAVVVVTNQSGIARGLLTEERLAEIHERLEAMLEAEGARLDGIFYCPHHPELGEAEYRKACSCRKPAPGLLLRAAVKLGLDLKRSWIIGDSVRDVDAGAAAGLRGILVRTGKEQELARAGKRRRVARDLPEAAGIVLDGR